MLGGSRRASSVMIWAFGLCELLVTEHVPHASMHVAETGNHDVTDEDKRRVRARVHAGNPRVLEDDRYNSSYMLLEGYSQANEPEECAIDADEGVDAPLPQHTQTGSVPQAIMSTLQA